MDFVLLMLVWRETKVVLATKQPGCKFTRLVIENLRCQTQREASVPEKDFDDMEQIVLTLRFALLHNSRSGLAIRTTGFAALWLSKTGPGSFSNLILFKMRSQIWNLTFSGAKKLPNYCFDTVII